jgi:hypothetical protein
MDRTDQRRAPRRAITDIRGTLDQPGDLRILDLSLHGVGLEAPRELAVGTSCFVELRHRGFVASLELEIRWVSALRVQRLRASLAPVFRAGAAILDLHRDAPGGVWDLLDPAAQGS